MAFAILIRNSFSAMRSAWVIPSAHSSHAMRSASASDSACNDAPCSMSNRFSSVTGDDGRVFFLEVRLPPSKLFVGVRLA